MKFHKTISTLLLCVLVSALIACLPSFGGNNSSGSNNDNNSSIGGNPEVNPGGGGGNNSNGNVGGNNGESNPGLNNNPETNWINPDSALDTSGLNVYAQYQYLQFPADDNAVLILYVDAVKGSNGQFMFNDGNTWMLVLETSAGKFALYPRSFISIGGLDCTVYNAWSSTSNSYDEFHVVITERTAGSYRVFDCAFDASEQAFATTTIYEVENINPIVSFGVN